MRINEMMTQRENALNNFSKLVFKGVYEDQAGEFVFFFLFFGEFVFG